MIEVGGRMLQPFNVELFLGHARFRASSSGMFVLGGGGFVQT